MSSGLKSDASGPQPDAAGWSWRDDGGAWRPFAAPDAALLEARWAADAGAAFATTDFVFNQGVHTVYRIDYTSMTQTNSQSGVSRAIRRDGAEGEESGGASPPKHSPTKQQAVKWSWCSDAGEWAHFAAADAATLEAHYLELGPKAGFDIKFSFSPGTTYRIDLGKMTQRNTGTGGSRRIRREFGAPGAAAAAGAGGAAQPQQKGGEPWWQFWDSGTWRSYHRHDAAKLEQSLGVGCPLLQTKDLTFNKHWDAQYIFDFTSMTQLNSDSGTSRKMRRVPKEVAHGKLDVAEGDAADDGYGAVIAALGEWGVAPAAPAGPAGPAKPAAPKFTPSIDAAVAAGQKKLGPQSLRGGQPRDFGAAVKGDKHGSACFEEMLRNEAAFAGEWAVFYHSYNAAALLYEVQAAVARVLLRFKSEHAALPRLLCKPFEHIPHAARMLEEFPKWPDRDHNAAFRAVGLCAVTTLLGPDPEAPPTSCFLAGYSVGPLTGLVDKLLAACGVPATEVPALAKKVVALAQSHGLDCSSYGGAPCKSGRAGHYLQIFIRRELVDTYCYASLPYGVPDGARPGSLSAHLQQNARVTGQVRITANPDVFLRATCVRQFVFSADPTYHKKRPSFQQKLVDALEPILGQPDVRAAAARGIYAGEPPAWWSDDDQSAGAAMPKGRYADPSLAPH